ncbi:hypothetical protein EI291_05105 [Hymenobacter rigui]|uniref:Uncharacterized protein n=2 Tax=Hymenobacter rigui TaxID=334424 RepID=A0A428KTU6_9BACT|nr:hypothetical protein EI291_05105 [Hymenobacter rigui]
MDFEGGAYIAQVTAKNESAAIREWATTLDTAVIPRIGKKIKARMQQLLSEDEVDNPVAIHGCIQVWCDTLSVSGRFMLLTIIKTAQDA